MENRKIILAFYVLSSFVAWLLSRAFVQYLYLTFYQIRRVAGINLMREVLPVGVAGVLFLVLVRHPRVNTMLDEVVAEIKKVTWPSRPDVVRSTTVVLICILIASFILAGFDLLWGRVITYLLKV